MTMLDLSMLEPGAPVVVGDPDDVHVIAVVAEVRQAGRDVLLVDAQSLMAGGFTLAVAPAKSSDSATTLVGGWIRRLAPPGWSSDVVPGSHEGVVASSWLALLTGWAAATEVRWLTDLDRLLRAEGKLLQLRVAASLGMRVPRTLVTSSAGEIRRVFPDRVAIKPLGPGQMIDEDGNGVCVPTTVLDARELSDQEVAAAPFIFQEVIPALRHLRVVTVGDEAHVAAVDADGLPVDWRQHGPAHDDFQHVRDEPVRGDALRLARAMGVRFSSQDWIDTGDDLVFLDLNPAGQWLFLPESVAQPVTRAIACWLTQERP